jgi:hypothetical protein
VSLGSWQPKVGGARHLSQSNLPARLLEAVGLIPRHNMVSVESARERVNLSRTFEKRPGRVVHGFPKEGVVTPQQVSYGQTRWVCSLERSCVCQESVNGILLMIVLSSDLIIDDSPFSISPLVGERSSLLRFSGPQPCLFQQGG